MPLLVRSSRRRHFEATRIRRFPATKQVVAVQDPIDTCGADIGDILIDHHPGQATVAVARMLQGERLDRLFLLRQDSVEVDGLRFVILQLSSAATLSPLIIKRARQLQSAQNPPDGNLAASLGFLDIAENLGLQPGGKST